MNIILYLAVITVFAGIWFITMWTSIYSELHLFATWPQLMENVVVDSESYSDFEPSQAPLWSVQVKMAEQPACLLSEYFIEFIHLFSSNRSMQDLLGDLVDRGTLGKNSILYFSRKINLCNGWKEIEQYFFIIPFLFLQL